VTQACYRGGVGQPGKRGSPNRGRGIWFRGHDDRGQANLIPANLVGRRICLVVLSTNHWRIKPANAEPILQALGLIEEGSYQEVTFERRPLRRHSPPGRSPGA
jgi:hypothetical protein